MVNFETMCLYLVGHVVIVQEKKRRAFKKKVFSSCEGFLRSHVFD